MPVYGAGEGVSQGHAVVHPNDSDRLIIMDENGSGSVWDSTDSGSSWGSKSYSHPFTSMSNWTTGEYTVGTIPAYGVIIAMSSNSSGGETIIWKPDD